MKANQTIKPTLLALLTAVTLSGCAVSGGLTCTETKNEKRVDLRFTNLKAASIFYQSFFENVDKPRYEYSLEIKGKSGWISKVSDNVRLNDAFRAADKNKNGVVSEEEAIEYVQSLIKNS